jgi:hypothetical protein
MSVVLIYDHEGDTGLPLAKRITNVVLPSRKVLSQNENDYLVDHIGGYVDRWKNDSDLRQSIANKSKDFYLENFADDDDMLPPDPNEEDIPLSAFYWIILQNFDNQAVSSEIFADDVARELLKEGGWFADA